LKGTSFALPFALLSPSFRLFDPFRLSCPTWSSDFGVLDTIAKREHFDRLADLGHAAEDKENLD
ncbi:MAG: hypothetical protein IH892_16215, partial [Planctomycetes bacterium]|nr:hypothetical protein [Planctomycetota bacterium]